MQTSSFATLVIVQAVSSLTESALVYLTWPDKFAIRRSEPFEVTGQEQLAAILAVLSFLTCHKLYELGFPLTTSQEQTPDNY